MKLTLEIQLGTRDVVNLSGEVKHPKARVCVNSQLNPSPTNGKFYF